MEDFAYALQGLINEKTKKPYTSREYIKEKRNLGEYGDEPEISALSKVLERTIRIYSSTKTLGIHSGYVLRSQYPEKDHHSPILLHFIPDLYAPHYQAIKLKGNTDARESPNDGPPSEQVLNNQNSLDVRSERQITWNKVLKRQINQSYWLIKNSNNRYNEILSYFQSGSVPKRIKSSKAKSSWKSKIGKKYKYDEKLDRILELKKVSYEFLSNVFQKPEFKSSNSSYDCWY